MVAIPGIIEYDEYLTSGGEVAPGSGAFIRVDGNAVAGHAHGSKQHAQRVRRADGVTGVVAAQVHPELPIGKLIGDLVCPLDDQARFSRSGCAMLISKNSEFSQSCDHAL